MIDKLTGTRVVPTMITGVSYLRGYIQLNKVHSNVRVEQDVISGKYFDQLFHRNHISNMMLVSLKPKTQLSKKHNVSYFSTLQGLMNKLQQHKAPDEKWSNYLQIIQEEIGLHQEIFAKRLQEGSI